jgi:superfamily I DNA and RNA helicase
VIPDDWRYDALVVDEGQDFEQEWWETLQLFLREDADVLWLGVGEHACEDPADQPRVVARIVASLLKSGFTYDDIVILTCHGIQNSAFSDLDDVGGAKLRLFTGEYDAHRNQVLRSGRLTFESVYRFKGQEAPAVILVDVDPPPGQPERLLRRQRVLYVGMTRATVRLAVVKFPTE